MKRSAIVLALLALAPCLYAETFEMESGDYRRTNYAAAANGVAWALPLEVQWESQACLGEPNTNPLVLPDKVILHDRSSIVGLQRGDGMQVWKWSTWSMGMLWNTPAYDSGRDLLYLGGTNGRLVALRASDGQPQWNLYGGTDPRGGCMAAPLFKDDRILYKDGRKDYVCIKASDRSEVWRWSFGNVQVGVTPALDGGLVYVAGMRGELACIDWATGATVWRQLTETRNSWTGAVTLSDDHFYVVTTHGQVQCRLRSNGSKVWSYQMDSYTYANLAFDGSTVYATSDDRCVHALDPLTGVCRWKRGHSGNFARSSPFVAGGMVFSSGCTGEYYGDAISDGLTKWVLSHGGDNSFNDWAYADGYLYVSNRLGKVFCFRGQCPACTPTVTSTPKPDTATPTATPTVTGTATPSTTASATPTDSPTATPSDTPTASPSATPTDTPTATPTASPSATPTMTPSATPSATASATLTASPSQTLSATATATLSATLSDTASATRTWTPAATGTATPSATPTPTLTATRTTATPTRTPGYKDNTGGLDDPGESTYPYPNPSGGEDIQIVFKVDGPCQSRIRVFQAAGDPAAKVEERFESAGVKRCRVTSSRFAPGIYLYKVDLDYDDGHHGKTPLAKFICTRK